MPVAIPAFRSGYKERNIIMIYSIVETFGYVSNTEWSSYKVPCVCDDSIYNRVHNDDPLVILAEKSGGYEYISEVVTAVKEAMTYNPYAIVDIHANDTSLADGDDQRLFKAFGATTEKDNTALVYCYPKQYISDNIVGFSNLGGDAQAQSQPRATIGFWGRFIPMVSEATMFRDAMYHEHAAADDSEHTWYKFQVWPENLIKNETYNFDAIADAPNNDKYAVEVAIDIWFVPGTNRFNATITLQRVEYDLSHWIDELDGEGTGKIYDTDNPYPSDQNPNNEGGNGDGDDQNDLIPVPDVPDVDITDSGVVTAFKLTPANVGSIFDYLSSNSPIDVVTKWWGHPLDAIVSIHILPNNMLEKSGGAKEFKLGGLSTGLVYGTCPQWQKINLGNVTVRESFRNALDYAPHTQASMYLPMIGYRDINVDDVMGKTVNLTYIIDIISGAATAFVSVKGPMDDDFTVRYTFSGSAASPIPIAHQDWGECLLSLATVAASSIGSGIASGASAAAEGQTGVLGPVVAGVGTAATSAIGSVGQLQKPMISRSGSMSGASCVSAVRKAYIILTRPVSCIPNNWQQVEGLPSGKGVSLGGITGYAAVESCHLTGITGTAAEIEEIDTLLRQGVIF